MQFTLRSAFHSPYCGAVLILAGVLASCGQSQPPVNPVTTNPAETNSLRNDASGYHPLYSLRGGDGGWDPKSSVTYVGGSFYGTTWIGGANNGGVLYALDSHGKLKILHTFKNTDGDHPLMGLTELNGTLYGTTFYGGIGCHGSSQCGYGTIYRISPTGANYKVIHYFSGGSDGAFPGAYPNAGNLIVLNGMLYGTAQGGGRGCPSSAGCGTVFAITPSGKLKTIYQFKGGADGSWPEGVVALNGTLYGTTRFGGEYLCPYSSSCGTIFSLTASGTEHVLYYFAGKSGYWPYAGLTILKGKLYGTTTRGGIADTCVYAASLGCGTVFEMTTSGEYRVLHRFQGQNGDGATPHAALLAVKDTLYGTTYNGPAMNRHYLGGAGTIFRITPAGREVVLHVFELSGPPDGHAPGAALTSVNGTLYGTTESGGAANRGSIFSLTP